VRAIRLDLRSRLRAFLADDDEQSDADEDEPQPIAAE
jgi:hypothetical protein